jgi:hypothetical protein
LFKRPIPGRRRFGKPQWLIRPPSPSNTARHRILLNPTIAWLGWVVIILLVMPHTQRHHIGDFRRPTRRKRLNMMNLAIPRRNPAIRVRARRIRGREHQPLRIIGEPPHLNGL